LSRAQFSFPARAIIIVGLIILIVGLLVVLRENPLFSAAAAIAPDEQSVLAIGAVLASVGQTMLIFGAVKANSQRLLEQIEAERQLTMNAVAKNMQQIQLMQSERQALLVSYSLTAAKLNHSAGNPKLDTLESTQITCKSCGAKMVKGTFCSDCGKYS
jgi:hypothetical protein